MNERTSTYLCPHGHGFVIRMWGECPTCQGRANREKQTRTSSEIKRLIEAMESGHEKNAYHSAQALRTLGHPDVDALCLSVRIRLEAAAAKGARRTGRYGDQ